MFKEFMKGFLKGSLYVASGYIAYYAIIAVVVAMLILGVILMIVDLKIGLIMTLGGLMALLVVFIKFAAKLVRAGVRDVKNFLDDDKDTNKR